ncbi:MAG: HDIG domain-containing metalloprotein [Bacteroidota bacterium]
MNRFFSFIRDRHDEIFKLSLVLLSIAIIVYLFPKEGKFRYDIENLKGKPWPYENLIAQFDFAINKSAEDLRKDKAEVMRNSKYYFRVDEVAKETARQNYGERLKDAARTFSGKKKAEFVQEGLRIFDTIYGRGVIQMADPIEGKPGDFTIMVIANNVEEEHALGEFFTVVSAYAYLDAHFSKHPEDEVYRKHLEDVIVHNVMYDDQTTKKVLKEALDDISLTKGGRVKGQSIISKGEIVTPEKFEILQSLKAEYEIQTGGTTNYLFIVLGQVVAVTLCMVLLAAFLLIFRKDILADNPKIMFILLLIILNVVMASFAQRYAIATIYYLPFCILPVIMRAFYDTRLALFTHLVTTLIIALLVPDRFEFVFIQIVAGIAAIFSIVNMSRRAQIFISAFIIFAAYCLAFGAMALIQDAGLQEFSTSHFAAFAVSSALVLTAYPLIFVFERSFGFVSDVTLMELSDTNSPLLRELASKAPGTFQHSLQVADLAEEVIRQIGGNVLLVRTGALYHDIGKTDMPVYFIENQSTAYNPHEELDFEESASIIISHVIKGIEKAKKHRVPDAVIDFIRTHHGTTTTGFFFRQYKISYPEGTATERDFQYPGPIPFSKETAVLMMADSVEASARTLKRYDAETIDRHVESIIDSLAEQNQFVNSDITFRDITVIKKILKKKLTNIYPGRVEYPKG